MVQAGSLCHCLLCRRHEVGLRRRISPGGQILRYAQNDNIAMMVSMKPTDLPKTYDPSRYEELVAIVKEGNDRVIRRRDGFISAFIATNADATRVVTVART